MPPGPRHAARRPAMPAFVLALALLGLLAGAGAPVWLQLRMAPGTLLPADDSASASARAAAAPGPGAIPAAGRKSPDAAAPPQAGQAGQAESGPGWETLGTAQKLALYPLAERWARISQTQKRRWLALAASYPALAPQEQRKFLERITDWASLSAQQRNQARLNFAVTDRLARQDKRAQWEAYQALPDAERRALAARAAPRPGGAATALRPVSPKKLAQIPAATLAAQASRPNAPKIPPPTRHAPHSATPPQPATTPAGGLPAPPAAPGPLPPPAPVETAPVSTPVAIPTPLPPLGAADGPAPAAPQPVTTPDGP